MKVLWTIMRPGFRPSTVLLLLLCISRPFPATSQESPTPAQREDRAVEDAQRLERAGRDEEALEVLEDLLQGQPGSVSGLMVLLRIAERRGEAPRVLPWAEKAVALSSPGGASVRQVWIRALLAAGHADSALAVARRWVESAPDQTAAWSELATLVSRQSGAVEAIRVLEQGREALGRPDVFVQELAVLYATTGRYEAAAEEWRAMLSWGDAGVEGVRMRVGELGPNRSRAVSALRDELAGANAATELRGGIRLALALAEHEWANDLVRQLVQDSPEPEGPRILASYVRDAREAGDLDGAAWAATELADRATTKSDAERWTTIAADLAYAAGDAPSARRAFEILRKTAEPGSDVHRLSIRRLHGLAVERDAERANELLSEYRALYSRDTETAIDMTLRTAMAWVASGELGKARTLAESVEPADAVRAARQAALLGRLDVLEGRLTTARSHLELAATVPGSGANTRTGALRWLSALGKADSVEVVRLGRAIGAAAKEKDPVPLVEAAQGWMERDAAGGSLLVSLAALELDTAGFPAEGDRIRVGLVRRWPLAPVAPEALLAMARRAVSDRPGQAAMWLEQLIVQYPGSALAPVARRELTALEGGVPGT